jgi:DNA-binding response OmpR family regulator
VLPHLLLVDDSVLVTDALSVLFEETGHRVTVAARVATPWRPAGRRARISCSWT